MLVGECRAPFQKIVGQQEFSRGRACAPAHAAIGVATRPQVALAWKTRDLNRGAAALGDFRLLIVTSRGPRRWSNVA